MILSGVEGWELWPWSFETGIILLMRQIVQLNTTGKDLDEAIEYAARIPTAKHGSIEIRPIMNFEQE